jgi:DNA-binding NarL/FixJ family response regulator
MPAGTPVRVVIADDHPMYRYGLAAVLTGRPDIELAAEASSGTELIQVVRASRPDVVITDLAMPGLTGAQAAATLLAEQPELAVLVLTMHQDDESLFAAMRAGARGYLLKGSDRAELIAAIQAVARGEAVYGPGVAQRIIDFFAGRRGEYVRRAFPELTHRERDVLDLLAGGAANREIASRLGIAEKTVRNHLSSVFLKLQVNDRTAAALKARDGGLGASEPAPGGGAR